MPKTPAELMMERETRVNYGPTPHTLTHEPLKRMHSQMRDDQFLLRGAGHHYFHYLKGEGITIERGPGADETEEELWLNGSLHSAVASMNGLLPIHASAVAINEQVYAFTGPGGAGKSTLVAALGDRGLPMFCDDTLILDISEPGQIRCLPGHKRLKLTAEALALTKATPDQKVSQTVEKFYSRPAAGDVRAALPLAQLIFLEEGPHPDVIEITGADRFVRLHDDHYTAWLYAKATQLDRAARFAHFSSLARRISMARFVRPRDADLFADGVGVVMQYLKNRARKPVPVSEL